MSGLQPSRVPTRTLSYPKEIFAGRRIIDSIFEGRRDNVPWRQQDISQHVLVREMPTAFDAAIEVGDSVAALAALTQNTYRGGPMTTLNSLATCLTELKVASLFSADFARTYDAGPGRRGEKFETLSASLEVVRRRINDVLLPLFAGREDLVMDVLGGADAGHAATREVFVNDLTRYLDGLQRLVPKSIQLAWMDQRLEVLDECVKDPDLRFMTGRRDTLRARREVVNGDESLRW